MSPLRRFRSVLLAALSCAVAGAAVPALAGNSLIRLRLDGVVQESPNPFAEMFGGLFGQESKTLHQWLKTIEKASEDAKVGGMVLIVEQPTMSLAQAEELTRALTEFRSKGKRIHCYLDTGNNLSYAVATVADDITIPPNSGLETLGLRAEVMFYKGLLDKIGVQAEMLHCGAYKSALEPFTRTEPSPEAADNINWLLDGIYQRWLEMIAKNRKMETTKVEAAINSAPLSSDDALQHGLVDHVAGFPDFKLRMLKEYGKDVDVQKGYKRESPFGELDPSNPFAIFQVFTDMMEKASKPKQTGIALIYIDGPIVVGSSDQGGPFSSEPMAGSTTIRAAFETARNDADVKAVVCRVNSPGGSAVASDIIWDAATRCAAEKPLIVSMGGVAGSGGYYVAIPGDTIFAEESTITGSIGVVGGKLVLRELMNDKLGITTTEFKRGKRAGLMSAMRGWNEDEKAAMEEMLNEIYTQFKGRVMQSRGQRIKGDLEALAGGRVYTGKQALEHGLVDKMGGMDDALALAAKKCGIGDDYKVYVLPKQPDFADFMKMLSGEDPEDAFEFTRPEAQVGALLSGGLTRGPSGHALIDSALPLLRQLAPEQVRSLNEALINLSLMQKEHVGCFMPMLPNVR